MSETSDEEEDEKAGLPVAPEDVPYLGEYKGERNEKDERHGQGRALLPNMDTYEGTYKNNKRNGYGVYVFQASGARYFGDWVKNYKHGEGTFIFPDGSKYEGSFCANKKHGFGKYYYINGDTYEGEWRNDLRHGLGTYHYASTGSDYIGTWRYGRMDGYGDLVHANHRYIGMWKEGAMFGKGKYVFDHGCQQLGNYVEVERNEDEEEEVEVVGKGGDEEEEKENVTKTRWVSGETTLITDDPVPPFDEGDVFIPTIPETPPPERQDEADIEAADENMGEDETAKEQPEIETPDENMGGDEQGGTERPEENVGVDNLEQTGIEVPGENSGADELVQEQPTQDTQDTVEQD